MIHHLFASALLCLTSLTPLWAETLKTSQGTLAVTRIVEDLNEPWSFGFLPGGGILITERDGRLWHADRSGRKTEIKGLPRIHDIGQGGLLDILIPRGFEKNQTLFFTYSKRQRGGTGAALARATLDLAGKRLRNVQTVFEMTPGSSGGRHFGSRLTEGATGHIFMSIGDRGDRPSAQDLRVENGSILRFNPDGSIPSDNPFGTTIWSYGHRNPQGLTIGRDGRIWSSEHGAAGGDEINLIAKGRNYGWPVISYGRHYSGGKIGEGTAKAGMEQPEHYWDPSIAPSGLMIYSGKLWPNWRGHLFAGSLKFDMISRLNPAGGLREVERLSAPWTGRIRDVREGPDGAIWVLSVGEGALFQVTP